MTIRSEKDDRGIVTITIDDPQTRNAISDAITIEALIAAIKDADADPEMRVIILTGAGPAFSSGGNLKAMAEPGVISDPLPAKTRQNYRNGIQNIPLAFEALEIPVIAAVNGAAIGAGCDLALMCDIRIAADSAKFAESFVRVGLVPGDGGAWLLPRVVGFAKASEMALTGDMVDAAEAKDIGLVSQVVPADDLMEKAREIALRIAANPPHSVRMTKRLLRLAQHQTLDSILELSAAYQALSHATDDHREAVSALLERRVGKFQGK